MQSPLSKFVAELSGPVARGAIAGTLIRLTSIAMGFGLAVLSARLLGVDGYGTVAFLMSIAMVVGAISALGFPAVATREIPRMIVRDDGASFRNLLAVSIPVVLIVSLILGAVVYWFAVRPFAEKSNLSGVAFAVFLMIPLAALHVLARGIARGLGKIVTGQTPFDLIRPGLLLLVLVLGFLGFWSVDPAFYLLAAYGALGVSALFALFWTWSSVRGALVKAKDSGEREPWRTTLPSQSALLLVWILLNEVNTLLLGWFSTAEQTGLYQPVARLTPILLLGAHVVGARLGPRISELWSQQEREKIQLISSKASLSVFGFSTCFSIVLVLALPFILALFGREFAASTVPIWVVLVGQLIVQSLGPVDNIITMTGSPWRYFRSVFLGLAVNVVVTLSLIPTLGALGAAIGIAVGSVVAAVWSYGIVRRDLKFDSSIIGAARHISGLRTNG